jgi:hypothetical protein
VNLNNQARAIPALLIIKLLAFLRHKFCPAPIQHLIIMALERSILEHPIPLDTQAEIASRFWGNSGSKLEHLAPYFQYYTEQCRVIYLSLKSSLPLKTHRDIIEIASDIIAGLSRSKVKENVVKRYTKFDGDVDEIVDSCIDLTARLVFMLNVGEFRNTFTGRPNLAWSAGPIQDLMREQFPENHSSLHGNIRLQKGFDVYNMVRIAGFKIELTTNLLEHLQLRDQDQTVKVFHHASFLQSQRGYVQPLVHIHVFGTSHLPDLP